MGTQEKRVGYLSLIVTICLFSTFEVTSKFLSPHMLPIQISFTRFFLGGLVLLPFAIHRLVRSRIRLRLGDFIKFAVLGLVNIVVSMGLIQLGLVYTNASVCAILFSVNPLFVMLFARIILKESLSLPKIIGLSLGILGLAILFIDSLAQKTSTPFGLLLILGSAICFALYTVLGKRLINKELDSLIVTSFSFIIGSAFLIPIQLAMGISLVPDVAAVIPQVLYVSIFVTGIAYVCYFEGLSRLEAGAGSMLYFAKPALASILSVAILHERVGIRLIVGIVVIAMGIFVAQLMRRSAGPARPSGPSGPRG